MDRRSFFGALAGMPLAATIQPKAEPSVIKCQIDGTKLAEALTPRLIGITDFTCSPARTYYVPEGQPFLIDRHGEPWKVGK